MDVKNDILMKFMTVRKLIDEYTEPIREKYKLHRSDLEILSFIYNAGSRNTVEELTRMGSFTKAQLTQSLRRLTFGGYAKMVKDEQSGGVTRIYVLDKALPAIEEFMKMEEKAYAIMFEGISAESFGAFNRVINKIYTNVINASRNL